MLPPNTLIHQLPYYPDSADVFSPLANKPWSIFLDSGDQNSRLGRFDIIVTDPVCTLVTRGLETTIIDEQGERISEEDPFLLIKQCLLARKCDSDIVPFSGGAMGYFSYDLSRRLESLPVIALNAENTPDMAVGIYDWAVIVDHDKQKSWLVSQGMSTKTTDNWDALISQFSPPHEPEDIPVFKVLGAIQSNMTPAQYGTAFDQIKTYLKEGDCYQVNLAQRFSCQCEGNAWEAYLRLRRINSAPYCAYLNLPDVQILSSSPERFLSVDKGRVETKPIKGTIARKPGVLENEAQIEALANSLKDRAENLMIVDLLRNDISKSCKAGSVNVPALFAVESFATVHHLVSTVEGQLEAGLHALDLLRGCFPGGSITGAPKIRAMEIIEELEPNCRGAYCGSIGYIGYNGNMDTNIAIRTLVYSENTLRFWAGGGIVNDSVLEAEYQECFDKAQAIFNLLEQLEH
ncbi:MAG TPA: aminodeoxychorismate synthase component I [Methylococcaceae bacterium]|jgi:para-aminobenzoate synthetase component 1|nr:aminodeoxychorismate synthase component I [Methylococcaceae bacterium]HIN68439.1 aminodeoxychorismate synthase component I [Methylococcales bacterium]HIA45344.1 aminodeoxychorismate synthase component I [Methylococcaceae bacterium]HIB61712.1 aminodeoxychorismate synthase component I [Methylococcaceae bacterium]HIO12891.1 aminodeoxychorismate synthase component I [Methylococcales bacterium]